MRVSSLCLPRRNTLAGSALVVVVVLTLAVELGAPRAFGTAAGGALLLYGVGVWPALSRSARGLVLVALGLAVPALGVGWVSVDEGEGALRQAAFIAALFTCFGVLREAAGGSDGIRRAGRFLAHRPPGQRYGALTVGGHLFGLILNFGAIPLLGTLILEGTRAADQPDEKPELVQRAAIRRRRMAQAVHRGFVATLVWSPLTVSMAVIFAALPTASWAAVAPWLGSCAATFVVIGWGVDRFSRPRPGPQAPPPETGSWVLLLPIVGLVVLIFSAGVVVEESLGIRLIAGVMIVSPLVALVWMMVQERGLASWGVALSHVLGRLGEHVRSTLPSYHTEVAVVAASAFLGLVLAALLPPGAVAAAISAVGCPPWMVVAAVPWIAILGGQVGMSPVLSLSLIAAAMPSPEALGLPPAALAVAYAGAWALVAASSPFTAAVLTSTRVARSRAWPVGPHAFGARENALFTLLCAIALTGFVVGLATVLGGAPSLSGSPRQGP